MANNTFLLGIGALAGLATIVGVIYLAIKYQRRVKIILKVDNLETELTPLIRAAQQDPELLERFLTIHLHCGAKALTYDEIFMENESGRKLIHFTYDRTTKTLSPHQNIDIVVEYLDLQRSERIRAVIVFEGKERRSNWIEASEALTGFQILDPSAGNDEFSQT